MNRKPNPLIVCACGKWKERKSRVCLECYHRDHPSLNRVKNVVIGVGSSKTLKEMAFEWGLSLKTVEYYWSKAKVTFGLHCPQDAVRYAYRHGWITL